MRNHHDHKNNQEAITVAPNDTMTTETTTKKPQQ